MCGIAGFTGSCEVAGQVVSRMAARLSHRGPDARGSWVDAEAGVALGHARLAIIDLAETGAQPMHGADARHVIAFNGEIYNHRELRARLASQGEAPPWRGTSDTETLLACIDAWGLDAALRASLGMFAFALYDRRERRLSLVRDRFGEKPLYYQPVAHGILFASEPSALLEHPEASREIEPEGLRRLLSGACIPAPWSIRRGVWKLLPGSVLEFGADGAVSTRRWFSVSEAAARGRAAPLEGDDETLLYRLETTLGDAVERQAMADVPVGAFLSGGIDSTLIVALMRRRTGGEVRTFSIGFDDPRFDEAGHAARVAAHLGTRHAELYLTEADLVRTVQALPAIYAEPFADASQVPTRLVAEFARREVGVALSGDAGDELFGGYNRHVFAAGHWPRLEGVPPALRAPLSRALRIVPERTLDELASRTPGLRRWTRPGEILHRAAHTLGARDTADLYRRATRPWPGAGDVLGPLAREAPVPDPGPQAALLETLEELAPHEGAAHRMLLMDQLRYLPDDILVKVDRAAMSVSLETRVPFLDSEVAELAWRLPDRLKAHGGQGKRALHRLLRRHLPEELAARPKMGFSFPAAELLRGPLRDWAESLLAPARCGDDGWLDPSRVEALWREHLGGANRMHMLWPILMFEGWRAARPASAGCGAAPRAEHAPGAPR